MQTIGVLAQITIYQILCPVMIVAAELEKYIFLYPYIFKKLYEPYLSSQTTNTERKGSKTDKHADKLYRHTV